MTVSAVTVPRSPPGVWCLGVRHLREGVYAAMLGPSYETPAEILYLRTIGADVVGMSTVLEAIAANHMGMKVLGISCVTNMAAGVIAEAKINHQEVLETGIMVQGFPLWPEELARPETFSNPPFIENILRDGIHL